MSGGEGNHREGGGGKRSQSGRETRGSVCRRAGGKTIERPEETGRAVVGGAEERGCGQGAWPPKAGTEAATGQTLGCSDGGVFRSGSQPVPVCP